MEIPKDTGEVICGPGEHRNCLHDRNHSKAGVTR